MKRQLILSLMLFSVLTAMWAQAPSGYYNNADGKKGSALKTALCAIISENHKELSYNALYTAYETTDMHPNGYLWDMYSCTTRYSINDKGSGSEGAGYNREHSFPKSWFSEGKPMYTDLFHVVPTDGYVNNRRSNYPFGENNGELYTSNQGFSKVGKCTYPGYTGTCFEPNDEYKGDFARIYFYMATRYENQIASWSTSQGMLNNTSYPCYKDWVISMLLKWAKEDPVSQKEIDRNNAVYKLQKNRNPYVDFPGLEQYVWGTAMSTQVDIDNYVNPNGGENNNNNNDDDNNTVAEPIYTPVGGTYVGSVNVSIFCPTEDATIFYTTDGSTPTPSSIIYTGPVTVTEGSMTIKSIAVLDGIESSVATATYTIQAQQTEGDKTYLFHETFDQCDGTGGNDSKGFGNGGSATFKADNSNWNAPKSYGGNQCARFNSSSATGTVKTPAILLPANTTATLSFMAAPFGSDGTTLGLSAEGCEIGLSEVTMEKEKWTTFTTTLTNNTASQQSVFICFTPAKRLWLDEVMVYTIASSGIETAENDTPEKKAKDNAIYNIAGQRIQKVSKGFYIKGGKKYIKK